MPEPAQFKYSAFLSYSHHDVDICKWLHAAIEGYRIDKDLAGRVTAHGLIPRTLRPVFRDREEFVAGHSLSEQTLAALEASKFLVVLCSPAAARSRHVNEEIRHFQALGRAERVIPLVVGGDPSDSSTVFPPELLFKVGADGNPTQEREEPLAADARPQGDGREVAKQKVVAALLGVGLDEILRRAEHARRRRLRMLTALAGLFLLLAVVATGNAILAYRKAEESNRRLDLAIDAYGLVTQATAKSSHTMTPVRLLQSAESALNKLFDEGSDTPQRRSRKAVLLISFFDAYRTVGQIGEARQHAMEARTQLERFVAAQPDNIELQHHLADVYDRIGDVLTEQADLAGALGILQAGLAIREGLQRLDPENRQATWELVSTLNAVGEAFRSQQQIKRALERFRQAARIAAPSAVDASLDPEQLYVLSRVLTSIGDALEENDPERLSNFERALELRRRWVDSDPENPARRRFLSWSYSFVGDALQEQKRYSEALDNYRSAWSLREKLAASDPVNGQWQRDLAWIENYIGDVHYKLRDPEQALKEYRAALAIFKNLVAIDVKNQRLRRDLAWTYKVVAQTLVAQTRYPEALQSFEKATELLEPLVTADPSAKIWRRDLGSIYVGMGKVLKAQGDLPAAQARYRQAAMLCGIPEAGLAGEVGDDLPNCPGPSVNSGPSDVSANQASAN
jgi:tetratricopeptide (TPR) repeat protein